MFMFHSNAWAPDKTSQMLSGQHGRATREVPLIEISKHHFAIVQAVPAQASNKLSHNAKEANLLSIPPSQSMRLRDPLTKLNKQIAAAFHVKTSQEKNVDSQ